MEDADEEALRLEELRRIKRATLHELDKQAAQYASVNIPPHIQTERQRLRRELGIVESVIASPLNAAIGDELGEASRFVAYLEQLRQIETGTLKAVAQLEAHVNAGLAHLHERLDRSDRVSMQWRRWGTRAFIILIIVVVAMLAVGMFWLGRLWDAQSFIHSLVGVLR